MRLRILANNLLAKPPAPPRPHGHFRVGGKPPYPHYAIEYLMAVERRQAAARHSANLEQVASANAAFEQRLAEARQRASEIKTALWATLLSEA